MERADVPIRDKIYLTVKEAAAYSGIGEKKIREIAQRPGSPFGVRNGSRVLINRKRLETYSDTINEIK